MNLLKKSSEISWSLYINRLTVKIKVMEKRNEISYTPFVSQIKVVTLSTKQSALKKCMKVNTFC